jgi:hypothetical protein
VYDRHDYREEKRAAFEALAAKIDHILRIGNGRGKFRRNCWEFLGIASISPKRYRIFRGV